MSGMCGMVVWDGEAVEEQWLRLMMEAAAYRGPDGRETHRDGAVGMGYLAHRVTPQSLGENQPLVHRPSGVVVGADLRLDNREELCSELEAPVESGDGELVVEAYLRWGAEWAEHLLGDFAIAVWDPRRGEVHLARDAMAMRGLYYRAESRRLLWATEVKQILAAPGVERRLNETAVATHLSGSHPPLGMSFYEGINQVEPGHVVSVSAQGQKRRRYWQMDDSEPVRYRREEEYGEHFRELFVRSVADRLRSVKPVGISLSGGMDSGSVACTAGWLYEQGRGRYRPEFRAYTWAFDELTQCDERGVSRLITDRYGIPVTDVPADEAWPLKHYPENGPDEDEPYLFYYDELMDSVVAAAAADGVGTLMTGERGDATVGHWVYDYPGLIRAGRFGVLARELRSHGAAMGMSARQAVSHLLLRPLVRGLLPGRTGSPGGGYPPYLTERYSSLPEVAAARGAVMPECAIADEARRKRYQLIFSAMSGRRVHLMERSQARRGVGYADPWSDRRLAEFVVSMPQHLVHRYTESKRIARVGLRPMLTDYLSENADGSAKADPTPLFHRGLRERSRETVDDLIRNSLAAEMGFVRESVLAADRLRELEGGPVSYEPWWFLTMEMWLRRHWAL